MRARSVAVLLLLLGASGLALLRMGRREVSRVVGATDGAGDELEGARPSTELASPEDVASDEAERGAPRREDAADPGAGEWRIPVPGSPLPGPPVSAGTTGPGESTLNGRVVTLGGSGVEGALVKALPLEDEAAPVTETTGVDGRFRLDGLRAKRHRLLALGSFAASAAHELDLEEGENEAGELVLPVEDSPGPIRGRLVAEPGDEDPFGVLLLRDLRRGREFAVLSEFELFGSEEDGLATFEILGVPAGEYELSVVTVDGRQYDPSSLRVEPPSEGLEFRARTARGTLLVFAVSDERTGATIADGLALGRTHGQWWGFEPDEAFATTLDQWIVFAPGYRAARGTPAQAIPIGMGEEGLPLARVDVELAPGFAAAILFKDAEGTRLMAPDFGDYFGDGLPGVQVLADGEPVAESDPEGLALVELAREPVRLTFHRPGWRTAGEREEDGLRFVQMIRE